MLNFMIHTPVNSRGRITEYVKEHLKELEQELNDEIMVSSPHDYETGCDENESWLLNCIEKDCLPDLVITHAGEFSALGNTAMGTYFEPLAGELEKRFPIRPELETLRDPQGYFYPAAVVAIVMSYNSNQVDQSRFDQAWTDLFQENLKVIVPDNSKHITVAAGAHILKNHPDYFSTFQGFERRFSPAEVTKAVAAGEYDLSITNAGFSMMSKGRGVEINPAREGTILLPQVLAFKKGSDARLLKLAALVLEKEIQDYIGNQGFFTSNPEAVMGEMIRYDGQLKNWEGWSAYIGEVAAYEKENGVSR
ncbi:ABC transporter substrate-binding protein [Acetobacterium carbinolicum]|uniref:ABC transporter substrate-binding protein n=1 Tax=Acetobacterium carbinolicum TaxID=52690 RepID=UPI0039C964DA